MIEAIVRTALNQRIVIAVIALALIGFGVLQLKQLSVDAFPDVTNVQVQVAAEAPGRSPEEVERFVTVPLEIAMTGLPGLVEMRSVNRNSLSQIVLVFTDQTDIYFARQLVLERLIEVGAQMPEGVTPVLGPVSSGLGEVYQYTLELPGDGQRALSDEELTERRTIQDWVVRPLLRGVPGVAEINSIGGYERQYQVEPDPDRLRHYGLSLKDVYTALALNNANTVLRRIARNYDDCITEPHIRRYFSYLMQYGDDDSMKGDFQIDARGSSALVEREIQNQQILQMGNMVLNPAFGLSPAKWIEEYLKSLRMDPEKFKLSDEEKAKMAGQQPPEAPQVTVAKIRAQTDMARAKMDADRDAIFAQTEQRNIQIQAVAKREQLVLQREIAYLEAQVKKGINVDQAKAKLAETAMKLRTQRDLAAANLTVDVHKHHNPSPQVLTPAVEPPGRAPAGQAFAR